MFVENVCVLGITHVWSLSQHLGAGACLSGAAAYLWVPTNHFCFDRVSMHASPEVRAHGKTQVQLEKLTASFQNVSEDLRRRFVVDGEPLLDSDSIGSSPVLSSSLRRTTGFAVSTPRAASMASSGALAVF